MSKLLFLILVGVLLYVGLKRARTGQSRRPQTPAPEAMVQCDHCQLHIPSGESVSSGGKHYCCEEHRRLGQR